MGAYVIRRLLWNIPSYLGILLFVQIALWLGPDPVYSKLGKHPEPGDVERVTKELGLDRTKPVQYLDYVTGYNAKTKEWGTPFNLGHESWDKPGNTVSHLLTSAVGPSLAITVPSLVLTALISIVIGLISAFHRGKSIDRLLMTLAVLGMSVSFLVYIIFGQYFGAYKLNEWLGTDLFAIQGYDLSRPGGLIYFLALPVLISTIVAMGYDTRYYRAVMVEESTKDYIRTARAKGLAESKVMFKHMLKNAMVSIVTRIMITLPFLITGSILLENFFNIPGMGKMLFSAIINKDFPVIQGFTAVFAIIFIISNILTDVLYALVDPRVRLT
jgi:peptide/nickel transport system permease protein